MVPLILLSVFAGCLYFIWMVITAFKRRWKMLGRQFAAAACYFIISYLTNILHSRYQEAQYYKGLFHTSVKLPAPVYSYASERAFNGDGYSLDVYVLPKEIRERFEKFAEKEMEGFPTKPDYRNDWKTSFWHTTPTVTTDEKYLHFALTSFGSDELARYQKEIRAAISRKGTYLAYFYFDHTDYPGNIDLFVVDLEGDRLYLINFNT